MEVKIRALEGPWASVTLASNGNTACRGQCCHAESHAQGGRLCPLSRCYHSHVLQGSVGQDVRAQRRNSCCDELGDQKGRARIQLCTVSVNWWDLLIQIIWNLLVLYVLYRTEEKYFHYTLIHLFLLLLKCWMFYPGLRALQIISPPFTHNPTCFLCLSLGLFSPSHNIKEWSILKPFLTHHKWEEHLSKKGKDARALTAVCLLLLGEVASNQSQVKHGSARWPGGLDCRMRCCAVKENLFSEQACLHSLWLTGPTKFWTIRSHKQAANLARKATQQGISNSGHSSNALMVTSFSKRQRNQQVGALLDLILIKWRSWRRMWSSRPALAAVIMK